MTRVNGRRTQRSTICPTAGSSARTRSAPMRRSNSVRASSTVNGSTGNGRAPSVATRAVSWVRLVTSTRAVGLPGNSGRT